MGTPQREIGIHVESTGVLFDFGLNMDFNEFLVNFFFQKFKSLLSVYQTLKRTILGWPCMM